MCQDESGQTVAPNNSAEVAVWPQHYLISRIDQTQQPPQTITLSDTIYRQADRSLLEAFYIYEADEESADFQPRQASLDIPHCQQDATLVQYLPDIFSKSNKECLHTIDICNDIPALSIYLVNGISANDVAQVLSLPPDFACPHYGYEWYLLNRSHVITHPSNVKWSDVILVTWRCRTTLYRIEALAKSVLRNYTRRDPMRLAVKDVMITIKPSFQAHIMYNGQSLFLPHRLECLVTFQISHPVTTKKVLRYSLDPLSSRQPTYIENILDTALIPEALQTWSREILRQRIYDNMAIH
jgi:hypothetical protein